MNYINKVCSFTGYRTAKLNAALQNSGRGLNEFKTVLTSEINSLIDNGYEVFRCGMAIGCDIIFAEIVLGFKQYYPSISLSAYVPCLGQDNAWKAEERDNYKRILESADEVKIISNTSYFTGCMQKRNIELVNNCDLLLAVYDGQSGGTKHTVEYAKKKKVKTIVIDPQSFHKITLYS